MSFFLNITCDLLILGVILCQYELMLSVVFIECNLYHNHIDFLVENNLGSYSEVDNELL